MLADSAELYHALFSLVENAVNYTMEDGTVTVTTLVDAQGVVARVTDTGIGIPPEAVPHIFDHFYRSEEARRLQGTGTGLGLAIVRRIIEIHRGTIRVESFYPA